VNVVIVAAVVEGASVLVVVNAEETPLVVDVSVVVRGISAVVVVEGDSVLVVLAVEETSLVTEIVEEIEGALVLWVVADAMPDAAGRRILSDVFVPRGDCPEFVDLLFFISFLCPIPVFFTSPCDADDDICDFWALL
jgi:hypothetical protein